MAKNIFTSALLSVEPLESRQMMSSCPGLPIPDPMPHLGSQSVVPAPSPTLPPTVPLITVTSVKGAGSVSATPPTPGQGCVMSPTLPPELDPQDISAQKGEQVFASIWHLYPSGICVEEFTSVAPGPSPGEQVFASIWHLYPSGICVEEFTSVAPAPSPTVPLVTITLVKRANLVSAVPPGTGQGCATSPTLPPELDPQDIGAQKGEQVFASIWHLYASGICVEEFTM
jgi:hypothetical protein